MLAYSRNRKFSEPKVPFWDSEKKNDTGIPTLKPPVSFFFSEFLRNLEQCPIFLKTPRTLFYNIGQCTIGQYTILGQDPMPSYTF